MRQRTRVSLPVAAAGIVVLFLVVAVASALQGTPRITDVSFDWVQIPTAPAPTGDLPTDEPLPLPAQTGPPAVFVSIGWIVSAVVLLLLAVLLARLTRWLWDQRRLRRRAGSAVAASPAQAPEPVADRAVHDRIVAAAAQLEEQRSPGDAIVAAWIGLEEAATATGVTRGVAETPAEFAIRVVARDGAVADDVRGLLALYESVRYGGRAADEDDRRLAAALVARIQEAWR